MSGLNPLHCIGIVSVHDYLDWLNLITGSCRYIRLLHTTAMLAVEYLALLSIPHPGEHMFLVHYISCGRLTVSPSSRKKSQAGQWHSASIWSEPPFLRFPRQWIIQQHSGRHPLPHWHVFIHYRDYNSQGLFSQVPVARERERESTLAGYIVFLYTVGLL